MDTPRTQFVSVHLTEPARDSLRETTLRVQPIVGRRLSMSAILAAALRVSRAHENEFIAALDEATG